MALAAILAGINQTGKMAPKKYVWSNAEEDWLMDLFEDNECLYQPATKGNSNRQEKDRIFLRISRQFEGATCKYCIIAQARVM